MASPTCDILVIGSGNAGFNAAISAVQHSSPPNPLNILLIDACPEDWAGGNTYFTAGAFRTAHNGIDDLVGLVNNVDEEMASKIDLLPYTCEEFFDDLIRVTNGRSSASLGNVLVNDSRETVTWLRETVGVRFQLSFNRQAYQDPQTGRWKFWGGLCLKTQDGGKGLIQDHLAAAQRFGVRVQFGIKATEIVRGDGGEITGVRVEKHDGGHEEIIHCKAVILASGGFEASPSLRAQHMGPAWEKAHVRGTPFNTGILLSHALNNLGAKKVGDYSMSGCHSVAWDAASPKHSGVRAISNEYTKSGYPLGLMLNIHGRRFVDEGVDYRNYTYAKFGRAILEQPDGVAFQVLDAKGAALLRSEEYRDEIVEKIEAATIEELAEKCVEKGLVDKSQFVKTVEEFNAAVYAHREENPGLKFDPAVKDGLSTQSSQSMLELAKSNWALAIDEPSFVAVKVTCGITFTFGGLGVNPETATVIGDKDGNDEEIKGLYCVGEMMGGLFWGNYPGGSGLSSGAVFGRRAGRHAAELVMAMNA